MLDPLQVIELYSKYLTFLPKIFIYLGTPSTNQIIKCHAKVSGQKI